MTTESISSEYSKKLESYFDTFITYQKDYYAKQSRILDRFFEDLLYRNKIYMHLKKQTDKQISSDFNIFDYLSLLENPISDYIGMLLDVNGKHGQGDLFQKIFIEYLNKEFNFKILDNNSFTIHREYSANGRIDIFLHTNETAIIIENKPYTEDQQKQLQRYYEDISNKFANVYLIYLGKGSDPSESSIPKEILDKIKSDKKYAQIFLYDFGTKFLRSCYYQCESQKVRFFIDDFINALTNTFPNTKEV